MLNNPLARARTVGGVGAVMGIGDEQRTTPRQTNAPCCLLSLLLLVNIYQSSLDLAVWGKGRWREC